MTIASDGSISDPRHLAEIQAAIQGEPSKLIIKFIKHAKRDHKAQNKQAERIAAGSSEVVRPYYKEVLYISKKYRGQIDHISKPASEQDKRDYPAEFAVFEASKDLPTKVSIVLLPGNGVCEQAVFDHLGINTIEDFMLHMEQHPDILDVFSELSPLLEAAKRWRTFMKPRIKLGQAA